MVPVNSEVGRGQRIDVRSEYQFPDRVPDHQDPGPHRVSHVNVRSAGSKASPCRGKWNLRPHSGRVYRALCAPGGQGSPTSRCKGQTQGHTPLVTRRVYCPMFLGHLSLCHPHPHYITSSCPSTILNCCVHPASSLTLSVISLAAPGEGY